MNYTTLDYLDNGVIIENLNTAEIFFMNEKAKKLLKVDDSIDLNLKFNDFFSNNVVFGELTKKIEEDFKSFDKSECLVYFRCLDGTFLEANFYCSWWNRKQNLVSYILKNVVEVTKEANISFKEVTEHLPGGIIVMNIEKGLSIIYANDEHYKILGITSKNTRNQTYLLKDFVFEEDVHWVLSETYLNLSKNEDVDIEFRIKTKDNKIKWVRLFGRASVSKNGQKLFYSSIKDLSQRRTINDKLHLERVMFYKITEITNEVIFRLDLQTNIIYFLGANKNIFGEATIYENYPQTLISLNKIHIDDIDIHNTLVYNLENGIENDIDIRYLVSDKEQIYEWFRISYKFIKDSDGTLISAVGKMSNINNQKLLEERAKTDLLTGFYNKSTTEQEINRIIKTNKENPFAFFIIDIDNFKAINDNLGHHFGDMVLVGIADDIRACFRETDILGRIGGDEFIVVMKDISNIDIILKKAENVCNILNKSFSGETKTNYNISASIGISVYPSDGSSFEDLYKISDIALYNIKSSNKNGYELYNNIDQNNIIIDYTPNICKDDTYDDDYYYNNDDDDNNNKYSIITNNDIISTIISLLYESQDIDTTIVLILEYIAKAFKVDKCYIFEIDNDRKTYKDTYNWCKKSKKTNYNFTKDIRSSDIEPLLKRVNSDGVFYLHDINNLKDKWIKKALIKNNVKSIFLIDSKCKDNNSEGILFIEDCTTRRIWSGEEVRTLLQASKIIFNTLNKYNIIKILNNNNNNNNNTLIKLDDNNIESTLSIDEFSNIVNEYYNNNDVRNTSEIILQKMASNFKIDKITSMGYNKTIKEYIKYFSYTLDTKFKDCSNSSNKQYKDCIDPLNTNLDDNILYLLSFLGDKNYIYINNYLEHKELLDNIGFTPINSEYIDEVYLFINKHETFFGYIALERYSNEMLSDLEINILTSLCNILNSGIAKTDLIKKHNMELLIKDIILNNEETPIAVVEKDSFRILYYNDFYYDIFPNIKVGGICYELLERNSQSEDCCFDKDLLINNANQKDHQWIKKFVPYTLENGKEVYVIYSKDSIDYLKSANALDNLTQALLFRGFEEYYEKFIKNSKQNYALCSLDIDKFKYINEIFDYNTGDKVLREVANVIRKFIDQDENFCRIGEDKFAIFMNYEEELELHIKMQDLSSNFENMRCEYFPETKITISAGVTLVNKELSLNKLLDQSIMARKISKGSHQNNFSYYSSEIDIKIKDEIQIEERIPKAIEENEFVPYIQPKFDIKTKKICGAEALVRWITPTGMIYPDQFIPLFEKNGFICTLDFIVYEKIMQHIKKCLDNGLKVYPISVNVSRNHVNDKDFLKKFMDLVNKYGISRKYLELEITESTFIEDIDELKNFVNGMKGCKLKVSIDDFGSAYSSLQNLTDIDVDILKIDKGFLNNIDMSENIITKDEILLRNIINLAKELDFHVICEGIETDEQVELLKKVGCEYGQGYVFARPMPIEVYEKQFLQD